MKELASATCYLFLLAHHLIFLSCSLSSLLVFHPSIHLAFIPLPPKSHNSPLIPACNQISSALGAALVLSATHPSDPMSPAGFLPPSSTFIALPCRHILPSSTAAIDLPPSQVSPPLLFVLGAVSTQGAVMALLAAADSPSVNDLVPLLLLNFSFAPSSLCEVSLASLLIIKAQI